MYKSIKEAKPNAGHLAIAELERIGKLQCLITQNVDGLHQRAGTTPEIIIELHGTAMKAYCLNCHKVWSRDEIQRRVEEGTEVPYCEDCGGIIKPATVSFGQPMPEVETKRAFEFSRNCQLFMVVGSSLVVHPAAMMPVAAVQSGARLVIINLSETPYDHLAHIVIRGKAGDILPVVVSRVRGKYT
jgi:NAD-dependent deacetylase